MGMLTKLCHCDIPYREVQPHRMWLAMGTGRANHGVMPKQGFMLSGLSNDIQQWLGHDYNAYKGEKRRSD